MSVVSSFNLYSKDGIWTAFVAVDPVTEIPMVVVSPGNVPNAFRSTVLYDASKVRNNLHRFQRFVITSRQSTLLVELDVVLQSLENTKRLLSRYPELYGKVIKPIEEQDRYIRNYEYDLLDVCEAKIVDKCLELLAQYKATRPKEDK